MFPKQLLLLLSVLLTTNQCLSQFFDNKALYRINAQTFKDSGDVQSFKNVSFVNCQINTVDRNTFIRMVRLVEVKLDNNELRSLHENIFDTNVKLQTVNLAYNRFTSLPPLIFSKLTSLKVLNLYHNSIMNFDSRIFENLKSLSNLNFFHNGLHNLDVNIFRNNINLEYLNFADNYIENLNEDIFTSMPKLHSLILHRNKVRYLPRKIFSRLSNLKNLSIAFNSIPDLDSGLFDNNRQLENVWAGANKISILETGLFQNAVQMKHLDLQGNKIENIETGVFASNSKLQKLFLSNNSLTGLDANIISNLKDMTDLTIDTNPWNCNCQIRDLYNKWKQLKLQKKSPKCSEPSNLRNRFWINLNLNDFPTCTIIPQIPTQTIVDLTGDEATLACKTGFTSENPWKVGDTPVSEHFKTLNKPYKICQSSSVDGRTWYNLTIEDLKPSDSGKYKCDDKEQDLFITSDQIKRLQKPTLSLFIDKDIQLNADFGENINAGCQIYSRGQKPNLSWSFNNKHLDGSSSNGGKYKISEFKVDDHFAWCNLTINNVRDEDIGVYSCQANGYNDINKFTLKVNKKLNTYIQGWTDY